MGWGAPAVIVAISLGATQAEGYGNNDFCWLSRENGLIWAFVGPALAVISVNLVCLGLIFRGMFKMKSMKTRKMEDKFRTAVRSICVLVPLMGVSWILGIFYVNDSSSFIQYIFAICNGLQGFFIFLFHCLLNPQVKQAVQLKQRRRSSKSILSFLKSSSKDDDTKRKSSEQPKDETNTSPSRMGKADVIHTKDETLEIHRSINRSNTKTRQEITTLHIGTNPKQPVDDYLSNA